MKLAFASYTFLPDIGGAQIMLHNVAKMLQKRGHQVVVFIPQSGYKKLMNHSINMSYEIKPYFAPGIYRLLKKNWELYYNILDLQFDRYQKKFEFDVWTAWMSYPMGVAVGHWAEKRNIPYAVRCAGDDIQLFPEIGYGMRMDQAIDAVIRDWLPKADNVVALSECVADEYRKIGINDEKIRFIPCGVDCKRFQTNIDKNLLRDKYGIPADKTIFVTFGRNHPKKGFKFLVEAGKILKDKGEKDFLIILVGKDMEPLIALTEDLGISKCFRFVSEKGVTESKLDNNFEFPSQEVIDLYNASDICVFPTLMETFALIVIEAWAARIPVITTDAPGTGEIVKNDKDALVVGAGDVVALSEKMSNLMKNKTQQSKLVEAGYINVTQNYDWERVIDIWEEMFDDIIKKKG